MRMKNYKPGDLVYAPQASLLWSGAKTIRLNEPTMMIVAPVPTENRAGVALNNAVAVIYQGEMWYTSKSGLHKPRRKDGDKTC